MRRLFAWSGLSIMVLSLLVVAIKAAALPDSYGFPMNTFHDAPPGCSLPCWNNITLGQTTHTEVKAILDADGQFERISDDPGALVEGVAGLSESSTRVVVTFDDHQRVAGIILNGLDRAGNILKAVGVPSSVFVSQCDWYLLSMRFPGAEIDFHAENGLHPETPVALVVWMEVGMQARLAAETQSPDSFLWRGLTTRRYFQSPVHVDESLCVD